MTKQPKTFKTEAERRLWSSDPRDKVPLVVTVRFPDYALHNLDVPGYSSRPVSL